MKKILAILLAGLVVVGSTGCAPKKKSIGLVQYVDHKSLNQIKDTFMDEFNKSELAKEVEIDYQNAAGDGGLLTQICQKFAGDQKTLIVAIATPSAQTALAMAKNTPLLFSAVTDPVGAGLVTNLQKPEKNATGVSDKVDAQKIFELMQVLTPGIKTVGLVYNLAEPNSVSVIAQAKDYLKSKNIAVVESTVRTATDVQSAGNALVGKCDAMFTPIDNTVASAMSVLSKLCIDNKIPLYVGADSLVQDGGLATVGINYEMLGRETARMAIRILKGEKIAEIPVLVLDQTSTYINRKTANALGIDTSKVNQEIVFID